MGYIQDRFNGMMDWTLSHDTQTPRINSIIKGVVNNMIDDLIRCDHRLVVRQRPNNTHTLYYCEYGTPHPQFLFFYSFDLGQAYLFGTPDQAWAIADHLNELNGTPDQFGVVSF